MAFMVPEYHEARAFRIDTRHSGTLPFFASLGRAVDVLEGEALEAWLEDEAPAIFAEMLGEDVDSVERDEGPQWYVRLSAPGYMDCTAWSGPHATKEEAGEALARDYDVDAETGEALDCGE